MPPRGTRKGTKRARQYEHITDSLRERGSSEDEARKSPRAPSTRNVHEAVRH